MPSSPNRNESFTLACAQRHVFRIHFELLRILTEPRPRGSGNEMPLFVHNYSQTPLPSIPVERQPQSLFERELRSVPEFLNGRRGIGLRIAHVARARRTIARGQIHALDLLQQTPCLVQRVPPSVACVKRFA